jgi:hypothetical protein
VTAVRAGAVALAALALGACDLAYPEVVVINRLGADVLVRNPTFSGCRWDVVLADGEATSPGRCLPGDDRVHFEKFDAGAWATDASDPPTWFAWQSVSVHIVDYGDFAVLEILPGDLEQDFSVPGPYGH